MLIVGNDVVDLNKAGAPDKHKDGRFVSRVFSEHEQDAILTSRDPDLTLWMFWAAKETGYKLISKLSSPPVFVHKHFQVVLQSVKELDGISIETKAQVVYADQIFEIKIFANTECVHAVGAVAARGRKADYITFSNTRRVDSTEMEKWQSAQELKKHFTEGERASIHHPESALVRFYSKAEIAKKLAIEHSRLQIIRPIKDNKSQPPFLLLDNQRADVDVSLSHHGKWLAWVYSVPHKSGSAIL